MTYEDGVSEQGEKSSPRSDARFASLSASLLARKGEAEPAMEAFAHARVAAGAAREMAPGAVHDIVRPSVGEPEARLEKADAPRMAARRAPAPTFEAKEDCPRKRIAASGRRAAVTFRMSVHDFLRLKLASAELETPSQEIIVDALAAWLDGKGVERLDNCRCLAEAARACGEDGEPGE